MCLSALLFCPRFRCACSQPRCHTPLVDLGGQSHQTCSSKRAKRCETCNIIFTSLCTCHHCQGTSSACFFPCLRGSLLSCDYCYIFSAWLVLYKAHAHMLLQLLLPLPSLPHCCCLRTCFLNALLSASLVARSHAVRACHGSEARRTSWRLDPSSKSCSYLYGQQGGASCRGRGRLSWRC